MTNSTKQLLIQFLDWMQMYDPPTDDMDKCVDQFLKLYPVFFVSSKDAILPNTNNRVDYYAKASQRFMYYDNYAKGWDDCIESFKELNKT